MAVAQDMQREWARRGAQARLVEIEKERAEILKAFPEIRRGGGAAPSSRPKRIMSPAARKAMSAGMRKFWAKRKAEAKAASK
jgi:hypothetical protein